MIQGVDVCVCDSHDLTYLMHSINRANLKNKHGWHCRTTLAMAAPQSVCGMLKSGFLYLKKSKWKWLWSLKQNQLCTKCCCFWIFLKFKKKINYYYFWVWCGSSDDDFIIWFSQIWLLTTYEFGKINKLSYIFSTYLDQGFLERLS